MKKSLLLVAFMAIVGVATAVAQPRAIGGQITGGLEFSYEHSLGDNFLSVDLGFPGFFFTGFGLDGVVTYNWLNPFGADFPTISKGDWNWYMGVGGGLGFHHAWNAYGDWNRINIGAAGRIGVEYNFWFPLQLSVEWRPVVGPNFVFDNGTTTVGFHHEALYVTGLMLGVRYKF